MDAFVGESETLGDCAALGVADGANDLDAIQFQLYERVVRDGASRGGGDAAALEFRREPVADIGLAIQLVEAVNPHYTGEGSIGPDAGGKSTARCELFQ